MAKYALILWLVAATILVPPTQAFVGLLRSKAKQAVLDLVTEGAPDKKVVRAIESLEKLSLGGTSLSDPNLPGNWLMVWTTSSSIAGKKRPKYLQTKTPPEQLIDIEKRRAVNAEKVLGVRNAVEAKLTPIERNKVKVEFKKFMIGPIGFKAPSNLKGELSVTYLDDDMRISRGDQGNAFILLRESSQREEADRIWTEWRKSWKPWEA